MKKVLLLVNTGTPDNPDKESVRRYLTEFLNDPMVIDIPWLIRKILVNFIIIPFRASKSARLYSRLWTKEGSPLKINHEKLVLKLQEKLKNEYTVIGAMRYGNPSISSALQKIPEGSGITVVPLFPQYASATTGSVKREVTRLAARRFHEIKFIDHFYSHPAFINVFTDRIRRYGPEEFDHIIFSYHSLPVRQIVKQHPGLKPDQCGCENCMPEHGRYCYRAHCYMTTRLIAEKLNLPVEYYSTTFQSQLRGNWIGPFSDRTIRELALQGKKKILVCAPSFVSDCLETLIEIREEYNEIFKSAGGRELVLVDGLNYGDDWAYALCDIIRDT